MATQQESNDHHHIAIVKRGLQYTIDPHKIRARKGDDITFVGLNTEGLQIIFPDTRLITNLTSPIKLTKTDNSETFTVGDVEPNIFPYAVYSEKERGFVGFCLPPRPEDGDCSSLGDVHPVMLSLSSGPVIYIYNGY